jgi:hypothetical protein
MRGLIVGVVLVLLGGQAVSAASVAQIVEQCGEAQTALTELAMRDQELAEQLTQNYAHILANMLTPMNARLIFNNHHAEPLTRLTSDFARAMVEWNDDVELYTTRLQALRVVNCRTEPALFANGLTELRAARVLLARQNQRLLDILTEYQAALPTIWEAK